MSKLSGAHWRRGRKRKERLQLRLWNLSFTSNFPMAPHRLSCQISTNQPKAGTGQGECKQTLKNMFKHVPRALTSLLMSYPPITISYRLFRCRYSNSRDVAESSPSLSPCSQSTLESLLTGFILLISPICDKQRKMGKISGPLVHQFLLSCPTLVK